jgi:hypothetical protein
MSLRPTRVTGCLLLAAGLATAPARAAVVWKATFEKGDMSEWMPGTNAKGPDGVRENFQVLGEQVYRGKFAGKITLHPDDLFGQYKQDRVDIQHQSTLTGEGQSSWISGHYLMPEDAKVRNEIAFFESNVSYQNVMDFWVDAKAGGGTTINFGVGFLGATKLWTADFTKGVWHQIAIHVLWSTNAQTGSVDVWFDGQQVVTAAKAKTKADANTLFFQTGLHRKDPAEFTEVIYFDDFIEADNQADAAIAAPSAEPSGSSGGTGGMAGAAGAAGGSAAAAGAAGGGSSGSAIGGSTTAGTVNTAGTGSGSAPGAGTSGNVTMPMAGAPSAVGGKAPAEEAGCSVTSVEARREGCRMAALGLVALLGAVRRGRRR